MIVRPSCGPRRASISRSLGACCSVLGLLLSVASCAKGSGDPYAEEPSDDDASSEPEPGDAEEIPSEVSLSSDDSGAHAPDAVGFEGGWQGSAALDSELELSFENGNACLRGQTAQILDEDRATYWGAQAKFDLCRAGDESKAVSECLSLDETREFVGIRFSLAGSALPWIVDVQFNELGRDRPARIWLQTNGDTMALFSRVTDPRDSSAPAVNVRNLTSITVRAAGTDAVQDFDFCVQDLHALFGPEWEDALVPDWIDEPGPGRQVAYVGANIVGAEFGEGNLPGVYGTDYIYPSTEDVDAYAAKGMNVFRVPFRWERMQRELYGELDATELAYMKSVVVAAREHDARVIIDPHNFARYEDDTADDVDPKLVGVDIEADALADFWAKLALEFANDERVFFGLMNEPHTMETETWLEVANLTIAAIREQGAQNLLLVPGNQWTGAHAWFETYYGTPNAEVMRGVVDPADNFAFELHQYFDTSSSGTSNACVSETVGVERVERVTTWLREEGYQGFLGEFGGSDDPICLGAMDRLLTHLGENSDAWLG